MIKRNLISGCNSSYKYTLGRFSYMILKHADMSGYHSHNSTQVNILIKGSYYEEKLKDKTISGVHCIQSKGRLHKYIGSTSKINKNDYHKIQGFSKSTHILSIGEL